MLPSWLKPNEKSMFIWNFLSGLILFAIFCFGLFYIAKLLIGF